MLLRWLPPDAAVWVGDPVAWTVPMELGASQVELTHAVCRLLMQLGGVKRGQLPEPLRIPRPGAPPPRPGGFDVGRFTEYLSRMEPRQR